MWTIFKVFGEFVTKLLLVYDLVGFSARRLAGVQFPDQGWAWYPLHWKAESQPQDPQGGL